MLAKFALALGALCGSSLSALADDQQQSQTAQTQASQAQPQTSQTQTQPWQTPWSQQLPSFALAPPQPSPWSGLYAGSDLSVLTRSHSKAFVGSDFFVGYEHELPNNFVIGIQGSTGFTPALFQSNRLVGYNYGEASVKLGYDMGRLMPYVLAGVGVARANARAADSFSSTDSVNALFGSSGKTFALGTVGAGFDYQITNNLSFGMAVTATTSRGGLVAP